MQVEYFEVTRDNENRTFGDSKIELDWQKWTHSCDHAHTTHIDKPVDPAIDIVHKSKNSA